MIHIKVIRQENHISKISLKGHAGFDSFGKDIVCAGVSSILTTTVNGILKIDEQAISYEGDSGNFQISVHKTDEITQKLLENMVDLFKELEQNYKKNIKVEEDEKCQ